MTKERIEKLLKAGANVVLTTKGIDDMALKVCFCGTLLMIFFFKQDDSFIILHLGRQRKCWTLSFCFISVDSLTCHCFDPCVHYASSYPI